MNQNAIDNETQEKLDAFIKQEEGDSNDYKGLLAIELDYLKDQKEEDALRQSISYLKNEVNKLWAKVFAIERLALLSY